VGTLCYCILNAAAKSTTSRISSFPILLNLASLNQRAEIVSVIKIRERQTLQTFSKDQKCKEFLEKLHPKKEKQVIGPT
jgi:hypothetical protein